GVGTTQDREGRPGRAALKALGLERQHNRLHAPAIAPSVNPNARDIRKTLRAEPAHPFDLVADLNLAQAAMDRPLKAQSATRGAPVVDLENHKAVFGQHLRAQVDRLRPTVVDHLRSRATIDRHDHRRIAGSRWPVDRRVELDAVARPKSMELRRPKIEIDRTRGMDHVPEFAVGAANGNAGRMVAV